ncbi:UNVERIFIED_CONTAM: hypothetical protein GTU68_043110 [Idotea baltica]|nr:hypothetical protein [Idotea baltica]
MTKHTFLHFLAIFLFISLFSVGHSAEKPTLNIYTYSSFTSDWGPGPKVKKAFEAECDCTLNYVALEDGVSLLSRLKLEGKNTKADVVLGLDTNLIANAEATGLFTPHQQTFANSTLPEAWTNETFIPYDYGYFAFVYDKNILKNPPKSLKELVETEDGPKILIQDPRTSTPGLGLLLWVKKVYGDKAEEAWKKLSPRIVTVSKGWSEAYGLFLKNEAPMVLSYTTSPAYHVISEEKTNFAAAEFDEGHYQQIEVAGLIKSSKQPDLGKKFLSFIQTETFQSIIPTTNWMYPAALAKEKLPEAFGDLVQPKKALIFDSNEVDRNRKKWVSEWLDALAK